MLDKKVIGTICTVLLFMVMFDIVLCAEVKRADRKDTIMLIMEGSKLSSENAGKLEDKIKADPNDLSS